MSTKMVRCISCGKDIEVTKFASPLKTKCDTCKDMKLEANQDIINEIMQQNKPKQKSADSDAPDGKKISQCIVCGEETLIGKFASHKKTLCDNCKGTNLDDDIISDIDIDLSKISRRMSSEISMAITPSIIKNKNLRSIECPACHTKDMEIIKIVDSSPHWGLVIQYQCKNDGCLALVSVSEQTRVRMKPSSSSKMFNYRGEQITSVLSATQDSRIRNSIEYLMALLNEHNIPIDGTKIPDMPENIEKTVEYGFINTKEDNNNDDEKE